MRKSLIWAVTVLTACTEHGNPSSNPSESEGTLSSPSGAAEDVEAGAGFAGQLRSHESATPPVPSQEGEIRGADADTDTSASVDENANSVADDKLPGEGTENDSDDPGALDQDSDGPGSEDSGSADQGPLADGDETGAVPLHACKEFEDRTDPEASRTLNWNFDLGPERCMMIRVGQAVHWSGNLLRHPLTGLAAGADDPIGRSDPRNESHISTFPTPGIFGYICELHTEMRGAIWVQP